MSLKRVSSPSVNPSGTFAVVSVYRYFVANNTFTRNLHLVDLSSTSTKPLTPAQLGVSDSNPVWLSNSIIAFTSTRKTGSGNLFYVSIADSSKYGKIFPLFSNNSAFAASASNLKAHPQSSQLAFTSLVQIKSSLSSAASSFDSGVVYDKLFTRHWDEWLSPNTLSQLFILKYKIDVKQGERVSIVAAPINLLKDTLLESPVPPHGDESHFEFSPDGNEIAFSSRVPEGSAMAWNTNLDIYVVSTSGNMTPQVISDDNQGTGKRV